jgi:hypothetical protein
MVQSEFRFENYSKSSRGDDYCNDTLDLLPYTNTNTSHRQSEAPTEHHIRTSQQPSTQFAPSDPPTNVTDPNPSELHRCWDSCCNGRTFSTKSNFTRHQRERLKGRAELKCSFCGVGFTRATARHAHEAERRCRNSGGDTATAE